MPPPIWTGISSPTASTMRFDGGFVLGFAGDGAVQVDQVQAPRALVQPLHGHGGRVFGKHRCVVQVALAQAHAAPVFEVDGGDE